ncbi:Subtilisin DY [termite gut metagenome]|uniref:Subtilisin DY n=1 Tax=termite gut metagenome TaxID=433724 RepID=A0A5J4T267_9ZZZZ
MRIFLIIVFASIVSGVSAQQQDTLKYRITLKDKGATTYSLNRPHEFLSKKAIDRRKHQRLPIDSTDLPVCRKYIDEIKNIGVKIVTTGKWENFVTVSCNDTTLIDKIAFLPFVQCTERVWVDPGISQIAVYRDSIINKTLNETDNIYGPAYDQIRLSNGHLLHEAGFKGKGMIITVIDAGFHNADTLEMLKKVYVLGAKDFVNPASDIYAEGDHGLKVFSCMAMNQPYVMIGTAPEASYWLLRSEDNYSEHLVEQDYWATAVEFADSVGTDVINTSLGYYFFDDKSKNYDYRNLDGHYALISRQASKVADKGMVMVCSAGNAGRGSWKKITPPADADNVLTVGAITKDAVLVNFSSIGNTADNRIKPDVMAIGFEAQVAGTRNEIIKANGTSFSSPVMCGMVTCLWQACPQLTAKELINLVRNSGDRSAYPDNIYGYGVPDMWKAYKSIHR